MTRRQDQPFDVVERPAHYNQHPSGVEPIDVIRYMTLSVGNCVKYVWRTDLKNGLQDLYKARWFMRDALTHNMAIWAVAAHAEARQRLVLVSRFESGNRKTFYDGLIGDDRSLALVAIEAMIRDHEPPAPADR